MNIVVPWFGFFNPDYAIVVDSHSYENGKNENPYYLNFTLLKIITITRPR